MNQFVHVVGKLLDPITSIGSQQHHTMQTTGQFCSLSLFERLELEPNQPLSKLATCNLIFGCWF